MLLKKTYLSFLLYVLSFAGYSQFYNGHQMNFGKNRVQYNDFVWSFYRYDKFDVYFNEDGVNLADYAASHAGDVITETESFFDYMLDNRIIFVVYNRLSDFRQSNIGLVTGQDLYNTGGTTTINRNKAFLYFEGDFNSFDIQIREAVARIMINELMYGNQVVDNMTNSTLLSMPAWFSEGLADFIAKQWDIETENMVRDGILDGRYKKFNKLTGKDAVYAGHSVWKFIADKYGASVIPSIVYLSTVSKSIKAGFMDVLGLSLSDLTKEWANYYSEYFSGEAQKQEVPAAGNLLKRPAKNVVYNKARISPDGRYIAYVSNDLGRYRVMLYDTEEGHKRKILKKGDRIEQITDYSYPVLAWHPSGNYLAFMTEEKGWIRLYYYNIEEKDLVVRNFLYFDKVLDFSFSRDGQSFVFSGDRNGQTDIYVHNIANVTNTQITNDIANDFNPRFLDGSSRIIFSSDRMNDTLSTESSDKQRAVTTDLFIYDPGNPDVLTRLAESGLNNKYFPIETGTRQYIQLNDRSGIMNRYISEFDSTVNYIDTTIHYRYYAKTYPVTNYTRNIMEQDFTPGSGEIVEVLYNKGRYNIYRNILEDPRIMRQADEPLTESQEARIKLLAAKDSVNRQKKTVVPISELLNNTIVSGNDTLTLNDGSININNYIFEVEKLGSYNKALEKNNIIVTLDTTAEKKPDIRLYRPVFYQNSFVSQVDFSFLNNSYQAFTGGAFYFNPGMNVLLKVGANDLFEDLKITAGVRVSPDFDANEYLLSFENLKKRLDKQIVFHREAFRNTGTGEAGAFDIKTHSHQLSLVLRYPLNQVSAFASTLSFRNDRTVYLSNNLTYLDEPNIYRNWLGIKLEYIHDNTMSLGMNLYRGMRYKIFAEFQEQVYKDLYELVVFGADFRHYTRIHRSLIWANRVAWSTSQGTSRIIYYLGGIDNWINLNPRKTPTFIPFDEIPIDEGQNYSFQAVATNMRGFSQNIRNGNNFMVFNSEIRFPVFKYFANRPLSRSFFENFQLTGFFDVGSAWSGLTPWSGDNAYDFQTIRQDPVTITIDMDRSPFVAGYGFGIHTQLLGYFLRFDWAWGIDNRQVLDPVFYFSTGLDF